MDKMRGRAQAFQGEERSPIGSRTPERACRSLPSARDNWPSLINRMPIGKHARELLCIASAQVCHLMLGAAYPIAFWLFPDAHFLFTSFRVLLLLVLDVKHHQLARSTPT